MSHLRIVCSEVDYGVAANVGGPVVTSYKTFDVPAAAVIAWLNEYAGQKNCNYTSRSITGVEVLQPEAKDSNAH